MPWLSTGSPKQHMDWGVLGAVVVGGFFWVCGGGGGGCSLWGLTGVGGGGGCGDGDGEGGGCGCDTELWDWGMHGMCFGVFVVNVPGFGKD